MQMAFFCLFGRKKKSTRPSPCWSHFFFYNDSAACLCDDHEFSPVEGGVIKNPRVKSTLRMFDLLLSLHWMIRLVTMESNLD